MATVPHRFKEILDNPIISELGKLFKKAEKDLFLVGGSVRDLFLDQAHEDLDFTTAALPDEIEKIVGKWPDKTWTIGKDFGTIGLVKNDVKVEITTYRAEIYERESRHPKVTFSKTIEEDLVRRDFTVNAMAMSIPEGNLIDPHDALKDLGEKVLRTPQDPGKSFSDDPLRMLRALRFMSTLGFKPDEKTFKAINDNKKRLEIVSKERIRDELSKLIVGTCSSQALRWMITLGLSKFVVPELDALKMEQGALYRHKDVLEHTFTVVENVKPDLVLKLAALLHDIGKPSTRSIVKGEVHFYGHDVVGARMAKKRLRQLRYPKEVIENVAKLIRLHLRPYTYAMGWTDSAIRRYARDAGELLSRLNQLAIADCTTRIEKKCIRNLELIKDLEKRIEILNEQEEIAKIRSPIDGNEIMDHLNIKAGKIVGQALNYLLEAKLDDKIKTKDEAYKLLDEWVKEKGLK